MWADLGQEEATPKVLWEFRGGSSRGGGGWKASQRRWHLSWALKGK